MTRRNGVMTTKVLDLNTHDIIQVPVENCKIISIEPVPSQMYDRKQRLIKIKVSPLTGPWSNCEGEFIVGNMEDMVVVEKYRPPGLLARLAAAAVEYFKRKPVLEALPAPKKPDLWT